jgi:long-subunit acyl-CoA synthetase (AMP-forming)
MTSKSVPSTLFGLFEQVPALPPSDRKPGSVGPGTDVQISMMDGAGNYLQTGQSGEVEIKGPNVIQGYENNPERQVA